MFDETTKKCIDKQKLAIPGDCKTYKECISIGPAFNIEFWREATCPIPMNFDPITAKCVAKNKYECCKYCLNKLLKTKKKSHFCLFTKTQYQ